MATVKHTIIASKNKLHIMFKIKNFFITVGPNSYNNNLSMYTDRPEILLWCSRERERERREREINISLLNNG